MIGEPGDWIELLKRSFGLQHAPTLATIHAVADVLIFVAYLAIPLAIWIFVKRRPGLELRKLALLFATFILLCGLTHLIQAVAVWWPVYETLGYLKIATALVSLATAIVIFPLIPRALSVPNARELQRSNAGLADEIKLHRNTLVQLKSARDQLEARVDERTRELHQANQRLEVLIQASAQLFWRTDRDGLIVDDLPTWGAFTGQTREQMLGWGWLDALHPDDRATAAAAWKRSIAEQVDYEVEYRIHHADGGWRWTAVKGVPVLDDDGEVREWVGMNTDISERKHTEDHTFLIMRELSHRTKNLLAVVSAMARRTLQDAKSTEQFARDFEARIQGLSRSHDLLVRGNWEGALLSELVGEHLSAFTKIEASRATIKGPRVILRPEATQTLGLALHELATNAAKHGALASDQGRIEVTWSLSGRAEGRTFEMTWREKLPQEITEPKTRGFGRTVLELLAAKSLSAVAEYSFEPNGVVWTLRAPAETVLIDETTTGSPSLRLSRVSRD